MTKKTRLIRELSDELLLFYYKASMSYYAVRKFKANDGSEFDAEPEDFIKEAKRRAA